jgi:HPt (histidine-containing phosphotransfer) domain-containing protein
MQGEYFQEVPIIALTANAISGMREMFLQNGFNDFLSKPIEMAKLNEVMRRWIPKEKRIKTRAAKPAAAPGRLVIEGVDTALGLAATGGSMEGYIKVLETYCQDADKRLAILAQAPQESDLPLLITQAHALKSASASIGAEETANLAAQLEEAGNKGDLDFIKAHLPRFTASLSALSGRIKTALLKEKPSAISPHGEWQNLAPSLTLLKNALAAENVGEADRVLALLSAAPLDEASRDALARISDLVLVGEFKAAAALAENLGNN